MPTCEYCGEDFPKGGAYATHVRYCDARPDAEATPQSDGERRTEEADAVSTEAAGGESAEGLAAEISEAPPETRATPPETDVETAESASTDAAPGDADALHGPGGAPTDDWSSRRWIAALVLTLVVLIVWRLLGSDDD